MRQGSSHQIHQAQSEGKDATKPFMVTIEATVRNIYVNGKVKISAYFLVYHQANLPQRISRQSRKTLAVSTGPPVQVLLAYRPVIQRKVFTPSHVEVSYSRKIIHGITSREVSMTAESLDVGPDQAYDAGEFASPQYPRLTSSTASQAGSVLAEGPEEDGTIPPPAVGKPSLYNPDVARQAAKDFGDMILRPHNTIFDFYPDPRRAITPYHAELIEQGLRLQDWEYAEYITKCEPKAGGKAALQEQEDADDDHTYARR
ncbi:hypothetical protein H2199_008921 [Coniosporium tulheliwenetii]|uniref:Uncharacterized protein n=1 Tax=Coniosporium tulheliwenetii TaxID=3383036 RepID=A0ACC2YHK9_9PEZI|nr:hypothetical protein H2199_008921 [Cladosporium sp. JES 115]